MKKIFFLFFIFLFFHKNIYSFLKISEIYPAPLSGEKEWIEVENNSNNILDLTNYYLEDFSGNKIYFFEKNILGESFSIASSSNILNNSGDTVYLKNKLNETIDIATYSGSFTSQDSYTFCQNGFIKTNIITKNASNNLACYISPTPTPSPSITPSPSLIPTLVNTPTPTIFYKKYENIFVEEALTCPETNQNEWIKIYNNNDFEVFLSDYYIDDLENSGSLPKKFSTHILAKNSQIINLSSSMFNNSGDSIRLLDFEKKFIDGFEYNFCETGKSVSKNDNKNIITPTVLPTKTPTITQVPTIIYKTLKNKKISKTIPHVLSVATKEPIIKNKNNIPKENNNLNLLASLFSLLNICYVLNRIIK